MRYYIYYKSNKELNRSAIIHTHYLVGVLCFHIIVKEGQPKTNVFGKRAEDLIVSAHRETLDEAIDCAKHYLKDDCILDGIYDYDNAQYFLGKIED
tara:strand:+ start:50 stop:337 length:288 start_codon:yes stop_codon:yes gene_type:complete